MVLTRKAQLQLSSTKKAAGNKNAGEFEPEDEPQKKKKKPKAKAAKAKKKECEDAAEDAPEAPASRASKASGGGAKKLKKGKEPAWSEPVPEHPDVEEEPAPKRRKKDKAKAAHDEGAAALGHETSEIATFARRYRPSTLFYQKKWDALKAAYVHRIKPFVKNHSVLEDLYEAAC